MANLYMMCGIPGSGKTTFIKKHLSLCDKYVSRDEIRFALLKDGEEYFSHEEEVLKIFYKTINDSLKNGYNTFVDATHLSVGSRKNFLSQITEKYDKLSILAFDIPLETALERNDKRSGRSFVPKSVIRRMYHQYNIPTYAEGFDKIYKIDKDGYVHILKKEEK